MRRQYERVRIYGGINPPLTLAQFTYRVGFWTMVPVMIATGLVGPWWGITAALLSFVLFLWLILDDIGDMNAGGRWPR